MDEKVGTYSLVPWQWVMFAEPARDGAEFLGVYITRALSFEHAVLKSLVTGNCLGGRADGAALPLGLPINITYCDRLLSHSEAQKVRNIWDRAYNQLGGFTFVAIRILRAKSDGNATLTPMFADRIVPQGVQERQLK